MYRRKDYLNDEIREEIDKKGFSIYNYISLKELLSTINKDYLEAINFLNIPFIFLFSAVGYFSYEAKNYGYFIFMFISIYTLIFIYLLVKLLYRTYKFSHITNVIYTKKGLIIGDKIFHYEEDEKLKNLLLSYEKLFHEYLSKPSRLSENIYILKSKLTDNLKKGFTLISKADDRRVVAGGFVLLTIYSVTIFIFYYLGLIFGLFIFFIFSFFITLYFKIHSPIELKIKDKMTIIDTKIEKLDEIYISINEKITTFKDGEISNLSKNIQKEFNSFYEDINIILTQKDYLKNIIESSTYKDFIDFEYLAFYIKTQFNKPLEDMINLLKDYKLSIDLQINEIENFIKNNSLQEQYQVEQKLVNLQTLQKNIALYLDKLNISLQ